MEELLAQFLIEGPELVQAASDALLALEQRPDDRELLDGAFRATHTLKGSVGLFDLPAMAGVLHAAEDVLGEFREGRRPVEARLVDVLLAVLSQTDRWLEALERDGQLPADAGVVAGALTRALLGGEPASPAAGSAPRQAASPWAQALVEAVADAAGSLVAVRYRPDPGSYFAGDDPLAIAAAVPQLVHLQLGQTEASGAGAYDPFVCRLKLELLSAAPLAEVKAAFRFVPDQAVFEVIEAARSLDAAAGAPTAEGLRTFRIDPRRVDALASSVEDLVTLKTALVELASLAASGGESGALANALAQHSTSLNRLAARLHGDVVALRLVPLAPLLRRYPRLVRDLAASLGKEVDLVVEDGGLEADKAVVDGLSDPLTHLLRNALDHGVEPPEVRLAAGKPARAIVRLVARRVGGDLLLEISDDGRGIDPAVIRSAARARGIVSDARLRALDDEGALDLIFLPGFSTAQDVTDLSGRGVGMDAVRMAVIRLGGRIGVSSQVGAGTRISLVMPLGVLLTKIMIVRVGRERYGVPMDRVRETLKLARDRLSPIRAGWAFDWRGRATSLVSLGSLVGDAPGAPSGELRVLVVQCGDEAVGVAVDAIVDRVDVVLRPMSGLLSAMPGVLGTTALGDGQMLMILDLETLIQ
jgi:two-component system chemotaxis sensor kinase CheA